jgi:hypothetical protein
VSGAETGTARDGAETVSLIELGRRLLASPLALPAILLAVFALYAPTLNDWFLSDDFWWLRASEATPMGQFVREAFDFRETDPVPEFSFYRPLYAVTFKVCYEAFGMNAAAYHALNVALHLAAVALVWYIARRLVREPALASVLTLIFALHPAYAETVAWISRGNTLMMTVAYLSSLLLFMKYLDGGTRAPWYFAGSLAAYVVAILYHPNALTLAAALPAYTFLIARRPREALAVRPWLPFLPVFAVSIAWFLIQDWTRREYGVDEAFTTGWHMYGNFARYLGIAAFPLTPDDWSRLDLPVSGARGSIQQLASLAMIGLFLLLLARRRWPYLGIFAVIWLSAALVFNTTLVLPPPPPQLYMPGASVAFFFIVAWLWGRELLQGEAPKVVEAGAKIAPFALAALLVAYGAFVVAHESDGDTRSEKNREFVSVMQDTYPELPEGTTVYVVLPPANLHVFTDDALDSLFEVYYGEVDAVSVFPAEVPAELGPNEIVFRYGPR